MDPARYFSRRARDERLTATDASTEQSRQAHVELSFRYEQLASDLLLGSIAQEPAAGPPNDRGSDRRAELACMLVSAFPLPSSGAFGDLLESLDDRADWAR